MSDMLCFLVVVKHYRDVQSFDVFGVTFHTQISLEVQISLDQCVQYPVVLQISLEGHPASDHLMRSWNREVRAA